MRCHKWRTPWRRRGPSQLPVIIEPDKAAIEKEDFQILKA
jgi:hypothetical protein